MKNLKKVLSLALCLIMVLGLIPGTMTAHAASAASVWVEGVEMKDGDYLENGATATQTTAPTDNYAYYKDGVLTLKNYHGYKPGYKPTASSSQSSIYAAGDLKIKLIGSNVIKLSESGQGICTTGTLEFEADGDASLKITATNNIVSSGDIIINSGTINIEPGVKGIETSGKLKNNGGTINLVGNFYLAVEANGIEITAGKVNVETKYEAITLKTGDLIIKGGNISVTTTEDNDPAIRVEDGDVKISGGNTTITAEGFGIRCYKGVAISGGSVDIKSTSTGDDNTYYAIGATGEFTYTGSETIQASTEPDGTLGEYVKANHNTYDYIKITATVPTTYTVTFDSDGGSAVAAQTVEAGQKATKPADPTKSGYTFKGWTREGTAYNFDTAVNGNITLKAKWEAKQTAIVIDEINIGGVTLPVVGATPVNSATTATPGVTIGSDTIWVRYVPETNNLKDLYDDSTRVDNTPFRSGVKYSLQIMLEPQTGYTIAPNAKIFYNGTQLPAPDASDLSKSCAAVYPDGTMAMALFGAEASAPTTSTVTVENGTGSGSYAEGATVTVTAPDVSGKLFKEWTTADGVTFTDKNAATTTFTMPAKAVTVTATYNTIIDVVDISGVTAPVAGQTPVHTFTISTPNVDYGSEIFWSRYDDVSNTLKQTYDDDKLVYAVPFRSGYVVALQAEVWADAGYTFTPNTKIRYNGTELPAYNAATPNLSSMFVPTDVTSRMAASLVFSVEEPAPTTYTVTFDSDGGSAVAAQTVNEGGKATKPADPAKEGYTFKGWALDGAAYDFNTVVTGDITLKAVWEAGQTGGAIDEIHISGVTMPTVGATPVNSATTSTLGVNIGSDTFWVRYVPETNNLKDLYDDSTRVDNTPFRSGVKYSLQVMLEPQAGFTIAADAKIFYNGIQLPAPDASDLSKSCAAVYPDGTMAMAMISGETATTETHTVTFDSDGGSIVATQTVNEGGKATKPADPAKEGYTFKGWTLEGSAYDFGTAVNGDITLKATWEAKEVVPVTYTVTFDSNGGSAVAAQTVEAGQKATKPADPTKEGYDFKGWTLDGSAYDFNSAVNSDITLKATWEAKQVTPPADDDLDDVPKTGDPMDVVLWGTLAMVSALAVAVLTVFKKKRIF